MKPRSPRRWRRAGYAPRHATVELAVEEMTCASCVGRVERALKSVPGVETANVNLATGRATVGVLDGVAVGDLIAAVAGAGYPAKAAGEAGAAREDHAAAQERETATLRRQALIAGALTLPIFLLDMGGHMIPALHHWLLHTIGQAPLWYLFFALATVVQFGPGWQFHAKGWPALLRGGRT
jgi:cation transport ATPase